MRVGKRKGAHSDQSFSASISSWSSLDSLFSVGGEVERDEEQEIGAENDEASKSSEFLACAITCIGHPLEIGAGEVGVRGKVDETEVDHELNDLHDRDVFLPPDLDAASGLKVVPEWNQFEVWCAAGVSLTST